jgi:hypothetical protein
MNLIIIFNFNFITKKLKKSLEKRDNVGPLSSSLLNKNILGNT